MKTATAEEYTLAADTLVNRIKVLIPKHSEILDMQDPWGLLKIDEFTYKDLQPSLFQVTWALAKAKQIHIKETRGEK